jgi:cytoskeletal protein CcmA (bactofilin family)
VDTPPDENETNSLEDQGTTLESDTANESEATSLSSEDSEQTQTAADDPPPAPVNRSFGNRIRTFASKVNIYLLLFIFIIILALLIVFAAIQRSRNESTGPDSNQILTQEAIEQLGESEAKVGDPKQTLNIESNAVFTGKVLVRDSLDVAGAIKVGGSMSLPGITVSGTSIFETVQASTLGVSGDATIQGQLNVQRALSVAGGASFGGPISAPQITIDTLQLNRDLQINRHIDAGGGTPGKTNGNSLGIGGTSSISGTDTAGSLTVNTGGNPPAGCFATIHFNQRFNDTPHVVITPVGSAAANVRYYITRNTASFSICTATPPPAGQSFGFDYIAID